MPNRLAAQQLTEPDTPEDLGEEEIDHPLLSSHKPIASKGPSSGLLIAFCGIRCSEVSLSGLCR